MKQLPNVYDVGKVRCVHVGFRVHKIISKFNKPMEPVGKIYDTPEAALKVLDTLGDGYAVFRIVQSKDGDEPHELINKDDLPLSIVSHVGPPRSRTT